MDAEILHRRLADAEGAIIKLDSRIDSMDRTEQLDDHSAAHIAHDERLTALEEALQACIDKLEALEQTTAENRDESETALALAQAVEASALTTAVIAEALAPETEAEPEMETEVSELEQEPEMASSGGEGAQERPPKSPNWLERLIVLR